MYKKSGFYELLVNRLSRFPLRDEDLRLTPQILKAQWQRTSDRLKRDPNRRLLQPAYRPKLRQIGFA